MTETIFLLMLFGLPGSIGFYLAKRCRKNPLVWGLLSAVFPFFLLVLHYQEKPRPDKESEKKAPPST